MTRRKKILLALGGLLGVTIIAGYFVANALLDRATRQAMVRAVEMADKQGLEIVEPDFRDTRLTGPKSAQWRDLRASIRLPEGSDSESDSLWDLHVDTLQISKSFSDYSIIKIGRVTIESAEPTAASSGTIESSPRKIVLEGILCRCELSVFDPGKSIRQLLPEVISLLSASNFRLPVQLGGKLMFSLRGEPIEIAIEVAQREDSYFLQLNHDDVAQLSSQFEEALTAAEVAIIADYPVRAARLLEIKNFAESTAQQAHDQDETIPQDAYRHVLWSYLLAKNYGQEFAKRVGDAHEAGDTGNTPAEREMDYHNNAIGRDYAEQKVRRTSILQRVLSDPNVRREP